MLKFDLQIFADAVLETVQGSDIVYMYRLLEKASSQAAKGLAFTTENEESMSADSDTTETKDGLVAKAGSVSIEVTASSILSKGDTLIDDLTSALKNRKKVELWKINMKEPQAEGDGNKYKATYYHAYLTEKTETSASDDLAQLELTFQVEGKGADGYATVTAEQKALIEYAFQDTTRAVAA